MGSEATLDDPKHYEKTDPGGIGASLADLPDQYAKALFIAANGRALPASAYDRVFFCGMGGSALGADLLCNFAGTRSAIPFQVVRGYKLPAYAGKGSLVFLVSYSGETEETLSCYRHAKALGAKTVAIASGGALLARAKENWDAFFHVPGGLQPRMATFYLSVPALLALADASLLRWDDAEKVQIYLDLLAMEGKIGMAVPSAENPAKQMALALQDKIVVVWGSEGLTDTVARSWKNQINENAKAAAWYNAVPEADHNEIAATAAPASLAGDIALVLLRDVAEHPRIAKRFAASAAVLAKRFGVVLEHRAEGETLFGRLWGQMVFGNYVSYYLSLLYGVDPQPVRDIQSLKRALGGDAATDTVGAAGGDG